MEWEIFLPQSTNAMNTHPGGLVCLDATRPILRHQQLGGREGFGRLPTDELVGPNSGGPGSKVGGGGYVRVDKDSLIWYSYSWTWP